MIKIRKRNVAENTNKSPLRVGIIGMGPIGSILAANLVDAGAFVIACDIDRAKIDMIKEAGRILKSGGEALVIDWDTALPGIGPRPPQVITLDKAEEMFSKLGFTPVRKVEAGDHHWGMIFKKL